MVERLIIRGLQGDLSFESFDSSRHAFGVCRHELVNHDRGVLPPLLGTTHSFRLWGNVDRYRQSRKASLLTALSTPVVKLTRPVG